MKKFLSLILSVSIFLVLAQPAFAEESSTNVIDFSNEAMCEYAYSVVAKYLQVNNMIGFFEITQGIPVLNDTSNYDYIFFIFKDGTNIAHLNVSYKNNSYCSSFIITNIPGVDEVYNTNVSLAILASDDCCYLLYEGKEEQISGTDSHLINTLDINTINYIEGFILTEINVSPITTRGSTVEKRLKDFPFVENDSYYTYDENGNLVETGLCWAASCAAVGKYETGISLTASELFHWVLDNTFIDWGFGKGSVIDIEKALERYNLNYTNKHGGLPAASVWNKLLTDAPILAGLSGYDAKGTKHSHLVVICGAIMSGSEYYYILMDPNYSTYITVYIGVPSSNNFTYYGGGECAYTTWSEAFYR